MPQLLFLIILLGLIWFLLILRPQRQRQLAQQRLYDSLEPGVEIITAGGIYGEVVSVGDDDLMARIAPGTEVRVAKRAVAGVLPPDEPEDEEAEELEEPEELEGELVNTDEPAPVPEPGGEAPR
jgi:preprotein translocase subunit YajC